MTASFCHIVQLNNKMSKVKRNKTEASAKALKPCRHMRNLQARRLTLQTYQLSWLPLQAAKTEFLAWIDSSIADLNAKIDALWGDMAKQETRLSELGCSLNTYSARTATTENEA